jgi:hypothetical protein
VAALLDGQGETYAAWPIWSSFKRGCVLHYCGPPLPAVLDLSAMTDYETPLAIMSTFAPGIVLDPCCGLGITSRAAKRAGWHSINFELHPRRMSRAMAQLKIEPHQVVSEGTIP